VRGAASRIIDPTCGTSNSVYTDASYFRTEIAYMLAGTRPSHDSKMLAAVTASPYRSLWHVFANPMR
jgi:hypothetical protein